ncbi:MAG TPA: hypothetical protein VNI01_06860 [Elusimicrobiota bacterium]|nr:hypothetical protein [Elusimicrobiota bacterium]
MTMRKQVLLAAVLAATLPSAAFAAVSLRAPAANSVFVAAPGAAGAWMSLDAAPTDILGRGLESALGDLGRLSAPQIAPSMEAALARELAVPGQQAEALQERASYQAVLAQALVEPQVRAELVARLAGSPAQAGLAARIERIAEGLGAEPQALRAVGAFAEKVRGALALPGAEGLARLFDGGEGLRDAAAGVAVGAPSAGLTGSERAALLPAGAALQPADSVFRAGIARPGEARAEQLEGIARDVARLRAAEPAALSAEEQAVLRGIADLERVVAIGRTTPEQLARAAAVVDAMSDAQVAALTESARAFLRPEAGPGPVAANWEHVNLQHITPLERDAAELAKLFNRNPALSAEQFAARIRLLMMVHDLGKVEMPKDMSAALNKAFPDKDGLWFVNTAILPHEYGSMRFIEQLGRALPEGLELSAEQTLALQRLIANHNFGPDLSRAGNAGLREHWWPGFFRRSLIPALAALGIPVEAGFNRDEAGNLQYNHAEDSAYSAILSAYDRALANKDTGYGVSAWYKFSNQDHQGWVKAAEAARAAGKAIPVPVFGGPALVARMEQSARWTAEEIESLWRTLSGFSTGSVSKEFRPYADQADGADKLNAVIRWVKTSNPKGETSRADIVEAPGTAYYTTLNDSPLGPGGTLLRVVLDYSGQAPSAKVEQMLAGGWGAPTFGADVTATQGANPVDLFFGLIKKDRIVQD